MIELQKGQTVFLSKTEEVWNKPFVKKRHHVYDTRSVLLKAEVTDIRGNEFKAKLFDNNGFEKDNQEFVFNNGDLLCNQNFIEIEKLGKWVETDNYKINQ